MRFDSIRKRPRELVLTQSKPLVTSYSSSSNANDCSLPIISTSELALLNNKENKALRNGERSNQPSCNLPPMQGSITSDDEFEFDDLDDAAIRELELQESQILTQMHMQQIGKPYQPPVYNHMTPYAALETDSPVNYIHRPSLKNIEQSNRVYPLSHPPLSPEVPQINDIPIANPPKLARSTPPIDNFSLYSTNANKEAMPASSSDPIQVTGVLPLANKTASVLPRSKSYQDLVKKPASKALCDIGGGAAPNKPQHSNNHHSSHELTDLYNSLYISRSELERITAQLNQETLKNEKLQSELQTKTGQVSTTRRNLSRLNTEHAQLKDMFAHQLSSAQSKHEKDVEASKKRIEHLQTELLFKDQELMALQQVAKQSSRLSFQPPMQSPKNTKSTLANRESHFPTVASFNRPISTQKSMASGFDNAIKQSQFVAPRKITKLQVESASVQTDPVVAVEEKNPDVDLVASGLKRVEYLHLDVQQIMFGKNIVKYHLNKLDCGNKTTRKELMRQFMESLSSIIVDPVRNVAGMLDPLMQMTQSSLDEMQLGLLKQLVQLLSLYVLANPKAVSACILLNESLRMPVKTLMKLFAMPAGTTNIQWIPKTEFYVLVKDMLDVVCLIALYCDDDTGDALRTLLPSETISSLLSHDIPDDTFLSLVTVCAVFTKLEVFVEDLERTKIQTSSNTSVQQVSCLEHLCSAMTIHRATPKATYTIHQRIFDFFFIALEASPKNLRILERSLHLTSIVLYADKLTDRFIYASKMRSHLAPPAGLFNNGRNLCARLRRMTLDSSDRHKQLGLDECDDVKHLSMELHRAIQFIYRIICSGHTGFRSARVYYHMLVSVMIKILSEPQLGEFADMAKDTLYCVSEYPDDPLREILNS